ncbi:MAG: glycosyltransferase [Candidatus Dojkabacteria bacterium]
MLDKKKLSKRIIVTGGGSGGHVSAASSIISSLKDKYEINENNFLYIGGDLGMVGEQTGNSLEKRIFEKEDFRKVYIRAGKLQRSLEIESIKLFFRTFLGFLDSYKIIKKFRPDILISTGGFVSVPVCIIAKLFKTKIYLHEQTAAIGLANKIVGKLANKIFVAFPSSTEYFPANKAIHTGNLIRKEIFNTTAKGNLADILKEMITKQERYPIIYISGGSLGSHIVNSAVKESMKSLTENFQIILQTGDNTVFHDYDNLDLERKKLEEKNSGNIHIVKYIKNDEIGYLFNNIDMYVGRAGANTVYEMGLMKIPSIFIPIPWVTHNEQERNAKILVELGLAKIIKEGELTGDKLLFEIKSFNSKEKNIDTKKLNEIFITNASEKILEEIDLS